MFYYEGKGESRLKLEFMRLIDEQFLETPCDGSRQMARPLRRLGYGVGRAGAPADAAHRPAGDLPGTTPQRSEVVFHNVYKEA